MIPTFLHSFRSEWLKRRRTAALWLTLIGGGFIPVIILGQRFYSMNTLHSDNASGNIWETLYHSCWQHMAFFLLPMGVILATSLVAQLEYRNNTWKQLHTTPQPLPTIFLAKLGVILVMLSQFFLLFNVGIYLTGIIPALLVKGVPFPQEPFPLVPFLYGNAKFFLACLPVVALQYLLSLQFRNFLLPIGAGLGMYIAGMIAIHWKYAIFIPYVYSAYCLMETQYGPRIYIYSCAYFLLFSILGYILFITKKTRG
ncbi:ABC transporter permease [Chitinophaga sp. 30R24]|uniref:ABC transporter permease n=1 Tax=Chitinophaga sp. 30R24 TaxID=3248838 RepID=UPI003B914721